MRERRRGRRREGVEVEVEAFSFEILLFLFFVLSTLTSEYLLVMHEPRASMTGMEVKFSEAMSSIPVLFEKKSGRRRREGDEQSLIDRFFSRRAKARLLSEKIDLKMHAQFGAAPRRLSSPTPRVCKEENAPSRYSACAEACEGPNEGEKGQNMRGCFLQETDNRRAFFFLQQPMTSIIIISLSLSPPARSPLPLLLVLEDPEDLRIGLDEGRECVGEDSLHFSSRFFSFWEKKKEREGDRFFFDCDADCGG